MFDQRKVMKRLEVLEDENRLLERRVNLLGELCITTLVIHKENENFLNKMDAFLNRFGLTKSRKSSK